MAKPVSIPNSFATSTSAIPLSYLDQDFNALANATNDLATYSNYVADTGSANAYIANFPANTNTSSLTAGLSVQFKAANANTGTSTLNVQVNSVSIGSATIKLTDGSNLPANAIVAGAMVSVMYDGTNFQLLSDSSGGSEVITNLTVTGNVTVAGTTTLTGNLTVDTNTLFVDTANNKVGIGTSSPVQLLTVESTSNVRATIRNSTESTSYASSLDFATGSGSLASTNVVGRIVGLITQATPSTLQSALAFHTNSGDNLAEAMRIDTSGNVGIGTSSPVAKLDVNGEIIALSGASTQDRHIEIGSGRTGSGNSYIDFIGDTTYSDYGFRIIRYNTGANAITELSNRGTGGLILNSYDAAQVQFNTNNTERMRIDSSGNFMVGTTSTNGSQSNTAPLIGGAFYSASGTTSSLGANAQTNFYTTSNQYAYFVHARGNTDAGYAAVWIVYDTSGGINAIKLGGHASLSIVQGAAGVMALKTTSGYAGQTYNYIVTSFGGY